MKFSSTGSLASMAGKTCLVTGGTSGIGKVTAEALARAGASVWIVGRDADRCRSTVDSIRQSTGNSKVDAIVGDLSSQAEIRQVAEAVKQKCPRLDVLINNAGAMFPKKVESVDGIEMTWALNHLGYFLLTNLLLDRLRASAPARIVNVASGAHKSIRALDFDDLESKRGYRAFRVYSQSKLANILFTVELAKRLAKTGVTANSLHPGFVFTRFFEDKGRLGWVIKQLARVIAISPEAGSATTIHLATSLEVNGVSSRYFAKCKIAEPSPTSQDAEAARELWEISAKMTGLSSE